MNSSKPAQRAQYGIVLAALQVCCLLLLLTQCGCSARRSNVQPLLGSLSVVQKPKGLFDATFTAPPGMPESQVRELGLQRLRTHLNERGVKSFTIVKEEQRLDLHSYTAPVFAKAELTREKEGWQRKEQGLSGGETTVMSVPVFELTVAAVQ